jgi:hypothetical protein
MNMSHVDEGTLHGYLDGELAPEEARGVAAHLTQCPACRNRLDEERALIARAGELLALAAPPDREIPPMRAGDLKPPARLWWKMRLPLAWAATVVLALGVGRYLGSRSPRLEAPGTYSLSDTGERSALTLPAPGETLVAERSEPRPMQAARARPPSRANVDAVVERKQAAQQETTLALRNRGELAAGALPQDRPAPIAAPPVSDFVTRGDYKLSATPLTLASARALLGTDPLAVPGLPVRKLYQARRIGYSAIVVVEQALDPSTAIDVINARPSSVRLEAVVVSGAAPTDTVTPAGRARMGREAYSAESIAPARGAVADQATTELVLEVRGPLSTDSLAALRGRLKPLRPSPISP